MFPSCKVEMSPFSLTAEWGLGWTGTFWRSARRGVGKPLFPKARQFNSSAPDEAHDLPLLLGEGCAGAAGFLAGLSDQVVGGVADGSQCLVSRSVAEPAVVRRGRGTGYSRSAGGRGRVAAGLRRCARPDRAWCRCPDRVRSRRLPGTACSCTSPSCPIRARAPR